MKSEPKEESAEGRKPLSSITVEKFIEIEDRLAQSLTSNEIQTKSTSLIVQIRAALSANPPDFSKAKFLSIELKQLNRLSNFRNQHLKNQVQLLQNNADFIYLSFNNLANEISHIRKSITACLDFRSADQELELVPVDEFIEKGAKEIGFDVSQKDNEHALQVGRLNYELAQRNSMCDSVRDQEELKNLLISDIKGKNNRLGQIRPLIGSIREAAQPLLDILNLKKIAEITPESSRRSQLLPKELKLMYLYCGVYNELYPDETLIYGCEGEIQAVDKFEKHQKTPEFEEKMEVDDEGPASKRSKNKNEQKDVQHLRERILQSHPIALSLAIPCGGLLTTLHFYYLPSLKCITLKSTVTGNVQDIELFLSEHLFADLIQRDSGEECPNEIGCTLLKLAEVNISDHLVAIGKPYRFAQLIGNSTQESKNSQSQFEKFKLLLDAIRKRVIDRQKLSDTLQILRSTTFERAFPECVKKMDSKHSVRLTSAKVEWNSEESPIKEEEDISDQPVDNKGFNFKCNIDHAQLQLLISALIPYSYPQNPSVITIIPRKAIESESLVTSLKEFEDSLNSQVVQKAKGDGLDILSTQLSVIVRRLPIISQNEDSVEKLLFG